MPEYTCFTLHSNRYDLNLLQRTEERHRFACMTPLIRETALARYDLGTQQFFRLGVRSDNKSYPGTRCLSIAFLVRNTKLARNPHRWDAASYRSSARFRMGWDWVIFHWNGIAQSWDHIDPWPAPRQTGFSWKYDEFTPSLYRLPAPFDIHSDVILPGTRFAWLYDERIRIPRGLPIRWDRTPYGGLTRQNIRFDTCRYVFTGFPVRKQSLVRPGWRILARNLQTDETTELGFIDADADPKSLTDVALPDGEYEILVLTSSLFWRDASNQTVRTITVGPDEDISPLPTLYNLRSTIRSETTVILWSAKRSEIDDCVFGIWYSADTPVDTDRAPDETVWYSPSQTEYQTTFLQRAPAYVAVAAIRTGNESELGPVHELYLDWSSDPPRAPDDVMVLDDPNSIYDHLIDAGDEELSNNLPDMPL